MPRDIPPHPYTTAITGCTITGNKQLCSFPFTSILTLLIKWRQKLYGQHRRKSFQDWVLLVVLILCGINGIDRAQHLKGNTLHHCNWINKVNIQALRLKNSSYKQYCDAVEMLVVPRINIFGGYVLAGIWRIRFLRRDGIPLWHMQLEFFFSPIITKKRTEISSQHLWANYCIHSWATWKTKTFLFTLNFGRAYSTSFMHLRASNQNTRESYHPISYENTSVPGRRILQQVSGLSDNSACASWDLLSHATWEA